MITNRNWLRWSFELRVTPQELLELWRIYREYHPWPVTIWDFLRDQRRTQCVIAKLAKAAARREVSHEPSSA